VGTCSLTFLAFLGAAGAVFCLLKTPVRRRVWLTLANAVFLTTVLGSWENAWLLAAFLLSGYAVVSTVQGGMRRTVPLLSIAVLLALFCWLKRYSFLKLFIPDPWLGHNLELLGLSYMTFKLIHMIVDAKDGTLGALNFPCFVNYQAGFFTLLAGPIQRYNDYRAYWERMDAPEDQRELLVAWNRVLNGVIKSGVLGALALHLYERAIDGVLARPDSAKLLLQFAAAFYLFPLYIYFNFAGYCDIVIGGARLVGLTLPENFDRPFAARNMIDFWNRWHITLSRWIRDYVFMTTYKWSAERWDRHRTAIGYLLLFLSIFLAGVWHGSTWNFLIFGVIQGLGVLSARLYGDILKQTLGQEGLRTYQNSRRAHIAAVLVTFHYICVGFIFFPGDLHKTFAILRAVASVFRS
jgi:D-alanyl-lipoteichoic acid acyltransferase DltB (MBOAT superfamily)